MEERGPGRAAGLRAAARAALLCALVAGAAAAYILRPPPEVVPTPSELANQARFADEGTLLRPSPELLFLEAAAAAKPKARPASPRTIDPDQDEAEARRVLGDLRELFAQMKGLADLHKRSDPARYAAMMSALKEDLTDLLHRAGALLKRSGPAVDELCRMIREETDPVVKERLGFLLRYLRWGEVSSLAASLMESADVADRRVGVDALVLVHTEESAASLIRAADLDPALEIRRRAIVGIGRLISGPFARLPRYEAQALEALRRFAQDPTSPEVRAAAWDAFSLAPVMPPEDRERLTAVLREERDPEVRRSAVNATRRLTVRQKEEASQLAPPPAPPR